MAADAARCREVRIMPETIIVSNRLRESGADPDPIGNKTRAWSVVSGHACRSVLHRFSMSFRRSDESAAVRPFWRARSCRNEQGRLIMRIVVIGGTGLVGSKLVHVLTDHGHDAVAAAPSTGVNTLTGDGLSDILNGAAVVVDVSNSPSFSEAAAMEFFTRSTANLLAAEAEAGVDHHIALSVVGTDLLAAGSGYFRAKLAQEKLISAGRISLLHPACDAVLRVPQDHCRFRDRGRRGATALGAHPADGIQRRCSCGRHCRRR
jgi:hypothetical protein